MQFNSELKEKNYIRGVLYPAAVKGMTQRWRPESAAAKQTSQRWVIKATQASTRTVIQFFPDW